jgi:hypothetical protein
LYLSVPLKYLVIHEAATVGFIVGVVEPLSLIIEFVCGLCNLLLGQWNRLMYIRTEVLTLKVDGLSLL